MSLTGCMVGGFGAAVATALLLVLSEPDGLPPVSLLAESVLSALDWSGWSLESDESPPFPPDVALELAGVPPGATLTETVGDTVLLAVALSPFDEDDALGVEAAALPAPLVSLLESLEPESLFAIAVAST